jgi:hypothetical protein
MRDLLAIVDQSSTRGASISILSVGFYTATPTRSFDPERSWKRCAA